MNSSLRELFARLGPVQAIDRVSSGSPGVFMLRLAKGADSPRTIDAMFTLARRGLSMLPAKRAIEAVLESGRTSVSLPMVEDAGAVQAELQAAGFEAFAIPRNGTVDVRAVRERLHLTREQFALHYGLEVEALRNWETGKREPDNTARSYLRAIANDPEQVALAYAIAP